MPHEHEHEQSTATIKCDHCGGNGLVNNETGRQITCSKCLGHCYLMRDTQQALVSAACDAQEHFSEDELEQHANKLRREQASQHKQELMPTWLLAIAMPFVACVLLLSGCATTQPSQITIAVNLNVCKHAHTD